MHVTRAKRFIILSLLTAILSVACPFAALAQQSEGSERLGMALEYFQTGKYHEALIIFQKLDKQYKLNPRFRAYIGLCYYYEWDYKTAVKYFEKVLPQLQGLSPHELSVYYYATAESYFLMNNYEKALPYYERDLSVCYDRDKGDIYYRIGLIYMFNKEWHKAYDSYSNAEKYYKEYHSSAALDQRLAQIANMKRGCQPGIADEIDSERAKLLQNSSAFSVPTTLPSPWSDIHPDAPPVFNPLGE